MVLMFEARYDFGGKQRFFRFFCEKTPHGHLC